MIIPVSFIEYADHLMGDNTFNISVLANVKESSFNFLSMIDFRFRMPDIQIEVGFQFFDLCLLIHLDD